MTSIEQVWDRMKSAAQRHASNGRALSLAQARDLVTRFMRDCRVDPRPSDEVITYYAAEFLEMIRAARHPRTSV